jgi:hypothetical protein
VGYQAAILDMGEDQVRVLAGCETSGKVREAFRQRGHEAWSCDLLPADDGSEHHIQCDLRDLPTGYGDTYGLGIFFPPCTDLCSSGARWFDQKRKDGRQQASIEFFMYCVELAESMGGAIENPVGIMSRMYRKPDQIIQPWQFGHGETKATCLWLFGVDRLKPTEIVSGREARIHRMSPGPDRWKKRSETFQGIADAMADQWGRS